MENRKAVNIPKNCNNKSKYPLAFFPPPENLRAFELTVNHREEGGIPELQSVIEHLIFNCTDFSVEIDIEGWNTVKEKNGTYRSELLVAVSKRNSAEFGELMRHAENCTVTRPDSDEMVAAIWCTVCVFALLGVFYFFTNRAVEKEQARQAECVSLNGTYYGPSEVCVPVGTEIKLKSTTRS